MDSDVTGEILGNVVHYRERIAELEARLSKCSIHCRNIDAGSPEAKARDRIVEIGFAEMERRVFAANGRAEKAETALSSSTDLANSWARELGVPEACDELGLHNLIDRLWAKLSDDRTTLEIDHDISDAEAQLLALGSSDLNVSQVAVGAAEIIASVRTELATGREERDALAAGLRLAHDQMLEAGFDQHSIENTCGLDACKRALEEHDQALMGPLLDALRFAQSAHRLAGCRCRVCLRCKAAQAVDSALAPYKAAPDCAGKGEVRA